MNEKTNNNRIPRNFNKITAKILTDTSANKSGEVFYIYKKTATVAIQGLIPLRVYIIIYFQQCCGIRL